MVDDECNKTTAHTYLYGDLAKANVAALAEFTDRSQIWYHKRQIEKARLELEREMAGTEDEDEVDCDRERLFRSFNNRCYHEPSFQHFESDWEIADRCACGYPILSCRRRYHGLVRHTQRRQQAVVRLL